MKGHKTQGDNFYERIRPRLYRRIGSELRLAGRLLDLGCGPCDLVEYLAFAYRQSVTGVDISSRKFPHRRRLPDGSRFHCIRKDAAHLGFMQGQSVDAVVTVYALHEMDHPGAIMDETYRILRPGGEILIVDFPRDSLAQKLWNEEYYQPGEIKELLEAAKFHEVRVGLIEKKQLIWARAFRPPMAREGSKTKVRRRSDKIRS